tara:strand:- start:506 stop:607 length:102 start_codon:yes stop_codon:yes gene_type:complete
VSSVFRQQLKIVDFDKATTFRRSFEFFYVGALW